MRIVGRVLGLSIAMALSVGSGLAQQPGPAAGKDLGRINDLAVKDTKGRPHSSKDWRGKKAIVLIFLGTECPVSNGYSPDLKRLANNYGPKGVLFYGVHADPSVTAAAATEHAREYGIPFTLLMDPYHSLVKQAGVRVMPETVVLRPSGHIAYRGRIDDRYALDGKRREEPQVRDLENALEAVLTGKSPAVTETKAFGCPLPRPRSGQGGALSREPPASAAAALAGGSRLNEN